MSLTGANTTPLGRLHPILAAKQHGSVSPTPGLKREAGFSEFGDGERKKKRKSRWGTEEKKTFIPGMPTTMPPNLSPEQQQAYIGKGMINDDIFATDSPSFSLIALRRICFLVKTCLLLTLCFKPN